METTTIAISKEVWKRLLALGKKNESFNQIIKQLLDFYEERKE